MRAERDAMPPTTPPATHHLDTNAHAHINTHSYSYPTCTTTAITATITASLSTTMPVTSTMMIMMLTNRRTMTRMICGRKNVTKEMKMNEIRDVIPRFAESSFPTDESLAAIAPSASSARLKARKGSPDLRGWRG